MKKLLLSIILLISLADIHAMDFTDTVKQYLLNHGMVTQELLTQHTGTSLSNSYNSLKVTLISEDDTSELFFDLSAVISEIKALQNNFNGNNQE